MNALAPISSAEPVATPQPDGSLVLTPDQLARFGKGNAHWGRRLLMQMLAMEGDRTIHSGPTKRPTNVRIATPADEPAIYDLLILDLKENAERVAPISSQRVIAHIQQGTRKKGGVVAVIDGGEPKRPIAVLILAPVQWWWSEARFYQEVVLFIHPEHRKARHFDNLTDFARWWTDGMTEAFGYKLYLLCGVLGVIDVWRKAMLYRRKFSQVGWAFLYPRPDGTGEDR